MKVSVGKLGGVCTWHKKSFHSTPLIVSAWCPRTTNRQIADLRRPILKLTHLIGQAWLVCLAKLAPKLTELFGDIQTRL